MFTLTAGYAKLRRSNFFPTVPMSSEESCAQRHVNKNGRESRLVAILGPMTILIEVPVKFIAKKTFDPCVAISRFGLSN